MVFAKILVCEDELVFHKIVRAWFKKHIQQNTYEFFFAANGREALEKIEENLPDLLVTDLKMPYMNGLELIEQLNRRNLFIPTIVITAYENSDNIRAALRLRVYDFIKKPFEPSTLEESIKATLKLSKNLANSEDLSQIKSTLGVKSENKIRSATLLKLAKQLPSEQKYKVTLELIETLDADQIEDLQYELPSILTLKEEEEEEEDFLDLEDKEREEKGLIPLRLLRDGYFEERINKQKLANGQVQEYGPYIYLRWVDPDNGKLRSKFLGKYEDINDSDTISAIHKKLPRFKNQKS
jgi:YesN/AraC family two-component response regulator